MGGRGGKPRQKWIEFPSNLYTLIWRVTFPLLSHPAIPSPDPISLTHSIALHIAKRPGMCREGFWDWWKLKFNGFSSCAARVLRGRGCEFSPPLPFPLCYWSTTLECLATKSGIGAGKSTLSLSRTLLGATLFLTISVMQNSAGIYNNIR